VLGSNLFAGFFGAESHHLWTLPAQHVLDALSFKAFGEGVAQARWVSVAAAVAILWAATWLALRRFGLLAALLCGVLLVVWRSNLTAGPTGVPLLDVARVARYDVLAVAFAWLAFVALDAIPRPRLGAFLAGVCAGLAALSQFFGVFVLPVLLLASRGRSRRLWLLIGTTVIVAPWLAYVALHLADLSPQLSVYGQRGAFAHPWFYVANVVTEPERYTHLLSQRIPEDLSGTGVLAFQASGWLLLAVFPALAFVVWRGHRLLAASLIVPTLLLVVLDQTKTPLYAIILVPSICLAIAAMSAAALASPNWLRFAALTVSLLVGVAVVSDGLHAYTVDRTEAGLVTPYLTVGQRIDAALPTEPADGLVLGPERFWWALHQRPYVSLRNLWFQWSAAGGRIPFVDLARPWQPRSVIVNNNVRDDLLAFPPALQDEFRSFLDNCTERVTTIDDPTYFDIQVYRVLPDRC